MLPSRFNIHCRRRFVNVSTGECIKIGIPDLRRHYFFGQTTEGFLVLCQMGTYIVQLLNPITGLVTDLPSATTLGLEGRRGSTAHKARGLVFHSGGLIKTTTRLLLFTILMG
ncbi:hypothetical protein PR202_gb21335 [Eleusine coracana subsp. coracana]|uniref:Uncharacterized protein n=1 Tax=Eleusine coracana subsp. coracana TaxID=191504 RepID=A0AAV5FAW8_ELECO|nr:hypothetical protein PR202_gb21335 [Eleusine coracana subsp. coracana]